MKFALAFLLVVAVSHGSAKPTITSGLKAAFQAKGTVDIMIIMKSDTTQVLEAIQTQTFVNSNQKVTTLYNELNKFTSASQKEVLAILATQRSAGVKGFYIANRISVRGATPELVESLSARSDIAEIREAKLIQLEKTLASAVEPKVLEWGVNNVNAPAVWDSGITGDGVVVSTIDTGVRATHESLRDGFRGAEYGWFDPYSGSATPKDSQGHGTHTMGSIAGRNGTGVAPGAQWIACLGCDVSGCTEDALMQCGEFTLCPTKPNGEDANCDLRPKLSSNSWGGGNDDTFYNPIIAAWNLADIIPIFAIGNAGPGCRSANSPGDQPDVISVGATGQDNQVASFSSHGPSAINQRIKPEVSAPGVNVRSAGFNSDTAYATMSGTSMATPHVAGVVALLLEKNPTWKREKIALALQDTAVRPTLPSVVCTGGGVDPNNPWPNNSFGWGKIDASAAIKVV